MTFRPKKDVAKLRTEQTKYVGLLTEDFKKKEKKNLENLQKDKKSLPDLIHKNKALLLLQKKKEEVKEKEEVVEAEPPKTPT